MYILSYNFACLGYLLDKHSFRSDPARFSTVLHASSPKSLDKLPSLLGFLQCYPRIIPSFSTTVQFLFDLSSQKFFTWSSVHENVLRRLLGFLSIEAVQYAFLSKLKSMVITDVYSEGIGALLEPNNRNFSRLEMLLRFGQPNNAIRYNSSERYAEEFHESVASIALAYVWVCEDIGRTKKFISND